MASAAVTDGLVRDAARLGSRIQPADRVDQCARRHRARRREWQSWRTGRSRSPRHDAVLRRRHVSQRLLRSRDRRARAAGTADSVAGDFAARGGGDRLRLARRRDRADGAARARGLRIGAAAGGRHRRLRPLPQGQSRGARWSWGSAARWSMSAPAIAAVGEMPATLQLAALALLAFVAGVSYAAWQERLDRPGNLWPLAIARATVAARVAGASSKAQRERPSTSRFSARSPPRSICWRSVRWRTRCRARSRC